MAVDREDRKRSGFMEEHTGEMHTPVRKGGKEVFFGLSDAEVSDRIELGQVNVTEDSHGRS